VLIGGTALTLRIGHRVSEDLDFAFPSVQLPVQQIDAFLRSVQTAGLRIVANQDPLAEEEFLNAGMDLKHYQQNYLVNDTVRITFVAPDPELTTVLTQGPNDRLRVATLDEIFASKCLVCADRSKTRDWFDLYVLMTRHGYAIEDLYQVFERLNCLPKFDIASTRLRNGRPSVGDEGYEQLLAEAPTLGMMTDFFTKQLDQLEVQLAKEAFRQKNS